MVLKWLFVQKITKIVQQLVAPSQTPNTSDRLGLFLQTPVHDALLSAEND